MSADSVPAPEPPAHPSSPWRTPDFRLLMSGRTVAIIGSSMTSLATTLVSYDLTHDAGTASVVMAFSLIGTMVVGLPAGALVDRWDRRRTMVWTALLNGAAIATIPLAIVWGHLTVQQLCVVCFISGGLSTFYGPAEQASLKRILEPGHRRGRVARTVGTGADEGGRPVPGDAGGPLSPRRGAHGVEQLVGRHRPGGRDGPDHALSQCGARRLLHRRRPR